jgi:hypothetical protein
MSIDDYVGSSSRVPSRPYTPTPAYRTSGFWMTFATILVSILVWFGLISQDNSYGLTNFLGNALEGVAILIPQTFVVYRYLKSRNEQQNNWLKQEAEYQQVESQKQLQELINKQVEAQIKLLKTEPPRARTRKKTPYKKK